MFFFDFALTISFAQAGMIPRDIIKIVFRHVCVKMLKSMTSQLFALFLIKLRLPRNKTLKALLRMFKERD